MSISVNTTHCIVMYFHYMYSGMILLNTEGSLCLVLNTCEVNVESLVPNVFISTLQRLCMPWHPCILKEKLHIDRGVLCPLFVNSYEIAVSLHSCMKSV